MPDGQRRDLRGRDLAGTHLGSAYRTLLHRVVEREVGRMEDRLRERTPDRPRSGLARALVPRTRLGAPFSGSASAVRRCGPWTCAEADGPALRRVTTAWGARQAAVSAPGDRGPSTPSTRF